MLFKRHMDLAYALYGVLFWLLLSADATFAWRFGGRPERLAAAMYVVAALSSQGAVEAVLYAHTEWGLTWIDALLLSGLLWLSITTDRLWPIPSAALQAIACLAHVAKLIEPKSYRLGYQLMAEASGVPVLFILLIGIWRFHRRQMPRQSNNSAAS